MNKKLIAQTNREMSMPFKNNPINIYYKQYKRPVGGGKAQKKNSQVVWRKRLEPVMVDLASNILSEQREVPSTLTFYPSVQYVLRLLTLLFCCCINVGYF